MIAVIADDLSGAAELAAVGWRHGLRAEIIVDASSSGGADLVCVDTDSRNCTAAEAEARVRSAAGLLRRAGARWLYKKMDSVLRGNVAVEVRALQAELGLPRALIVPANPSLGRIVRDGRYFVGGRPLDETEFARDPAYPRHSSRVTDLLRVTGSPDVPVCKLADELPPSGIVVGEAASLQDLQSWAARVDPQTLPAGAAEFFAALAKKSADANPRAAETATPSPIAELFVCGSTSESSQKFIASSRDAGVSVLSLPDDNSATTQTIQQAVEQLNQNHRVILHIGRPLTRDQVVARALTAQLVDLAALILGQARVPRVYAEGGETAVTLLRRMHWGRLTVTHEWAQGVVEVAIEGRGDLHFILKPGTYTWPASLRHPMVGQ